MYTRYHSILILVAILMIWNGVDASGRGGRRIVPVSSAPGRGAPAHAPPLPPQITMESLFGQYLKATKDDKDKRWLKSTSQTDFLNQYNQAITSVDNISKHGETNPVHLVVYSILCKSALAAGREPIAGGSASGSQVCPKIDTIQNPAMTTLVRIIGSVTFPGLVSPPPQLPGVILSVDANESVLERLQNIVPQTVDWPEEPPVNLSDLIQLWNSLVNRTPNTIIPPNRLLVVGLMAMAIFENSPINIGGDHHDALYETRICENIALVLGIEIRDQFKLASSRAQSCTDIPHDPKPEIVALYNKYLSLPHDNTPTTREQVITAWNNFVERPRGYIEAVNAITSRQTAIALIQLSRLIVGDRKLIPTTYLPESLCPIIATDQTSRREFTCPQPPAAGEDDAVAQRWIRRETAIANLQAAITGPSPDAYSISWRVYYLQSLWDQVQPADDVRARDHFSRATISIDQLVIEWNKLVNRQSEMIVSNSYMFFGLKSLARIENAPLDVGKIGEKTRHICEDIKYVAGDEYARGITVPGHWPGTNCESVLASSSPVGPQDVERVAYRNLLEATRIGDFSAVLIGDVVAAWNRFVTDPVAASTACRDSPRLAWALVNLYRIIGLRAIPESVANAATLCPILAIDQPAREDFACPPLPFGQWNTPFQQSMVEGWWHDRDAAIANLKAAVIASLPPPPPLVPVINPFEESMIRFWTSKCADRTARQAWFERMISMYDVETGGGIGQFFRREAFPDLYEFLRSTYSDDESFARISTESRLLYPANGHTVDEIVHAAIWRVPGYQGGLQTGWYNPDKFSQVYENVGSTDDAAVPNMRAEATARLIREAVPRIDPADDDAVNYALSHRIVRTYTFGILSPAKVYRNDPPTLENTHWIHVLHVWGVNFESDQTQDWNAIVTPNMPRGDDPFNIEGFTRAYAQRMNQLFTIIKQGIIETANILTQHHRDVTILRVRIPGIGQGAFLRGFEDHPELPPELVEICNFQFLKAMNDVLFSKNDAELFASASAETRQRIASGNFSLSLRFVELGQLPDIVLHQRAELASVLTEPQDTGPRSYIQGRVLFDYPEGDPTTYHLLINAWDPMTFIGNGGSRDASLDGWIAGGYAFERYPRFASTVWLSNLHMIPSLIEHMVAVEEGV